jgi:hypothetical protein
MPMDIMSYLRIACRNCVALEWFSFFLVHAIRYAITIGIIHENLILVAEDRKVFSSLWTLYLLHHNLETKD